MKYFIGAILMPLILTIQTIACAWASGSQQEKLFASDVEANDFFGRSVSLSSDGNTALVGAYQEDEGASTAGAAYVYTRSGSTWTEQTELQGGDVGNSGGFGYYVSLSSNGNIALITALSDDAAYVFTRSGSNWTECKKLVGNDTVSFDSFGESAAISDDGSTVIIGATGEDSGSPEQSNGGSAYIFIQQ